MQKHIITYYETSAPTGSNNVSSGYALGQRWFNVSTGIEYLHTSSGVWNISNYIFSGATNITLGRTSSLITISHTDTTRSDTTSSITPSAGATFSSISSVTTNSTGHVTAVNVKTITLPADTNTTYTFGSGTTQGAFSVTPSGSSAQSISIYGLGSNAYSSTAFLPLAGGTMSGVLKVLTNTFSDNTAEAGYRIKFNDNGGITNDIGIGLNGTTGAENMWFNSLNGFSFYSGTNGKKLDLNGSGAMYMYGGNITMNLNPTYNSEGIILGNHSQYTNGNEIGLYNSDSDAMIAGMYDANEDGQIDTYSFANGHVTISPNTNTGIISSSMTFTGLNKFTQLVAITYDYTGLFNNFVADKLLLFQPNIHVNLGGTSTNVNQDIKTWRSELVVNNTGTGLQIYDEIKSINIKAIYINDTSSNGPININELSAFEFNGFYAYDAGTITNAYSFRSDGSTFNGITGNHCTNYYGLYLGAVTGATNNYGVYQNDSNAKNVYGGISYFNNTINATSILHIGTNNFKIKASDELTFSYDDNGDNGGNTTANFRSTGDFQDVAYVSDLGSYANIWGINTFQAVQHFNYGLTATGATFNGSVKVLSNNIDLLYAANWAYLNNSGTSGGIRIATGNGSGALTTGIEVSSTGGYVKLNHNTIISSYLGVGTGSTAPIYPIQVGSTAGTSGISIFAIGDITAFSDESVKSDLQIIPNAIDKIKKLNGYTYIRTDMESNLRKAGVIAQEVQKVLPEVITINPDGTLSVAYANMVSLLIEAIKEQQVEIDYLKSKLT